MDPVVDLNEDDDDDEIEIVIENNKEKKEEKEDEGKMITFISDPVIRKEIGESKYDYNYKTYLCCFDLTPIALTTESTKIMIDELTMDWYRVHKFLPRDVEERIKNDVNVNESGFRYSRTQYIHTRCWNILQDPANSAIVALLKEKQRVRLPTTKNATIYKFVRKIHDETRLCTYGDGQLDEWHPGFRYIFFDDKSRTTHYMHYHCYEKLRHSEEREKEKVKNSVSDFYTPPQNPESIKLWDLPLLRRKVDEWRDFLGRFALNESDIQQFSIFLMNITEVISKNIDNDEDRQVWKNELERIINLSEDEEKFVKNSTIDEKKSELDRFQNILNSYPRQSTEDTAKIYRYYNFIQFSILLESTKKVKT